MSVPEGPLFLRESREIAELLEDSNTTRLVELAEDGDWSTPFEHRAMNIDYLSPNWQIIMRGNWLAAMDVAIFAHAYHNEGILPVTAPVHWVYGGEILFHVVDSFGPPNKWRQVWEDLSELELGESERRSLLRTLEIMKQLGYDMRRDETVASLCRDERGRLTTPGFQPRTFKNQDDILEGLIDEKGPFKELYHLMQAMMLRTRDYGLEREKRSGIERDRRAEYVPVGATTN